jgi:hypothetical protein
MLIGMTNLLLFDCNFAFESGQLRRRMKALKSIYRIIMKELNHLENMTHEQWLRCLRLWEKLL